MKDLIADGRIGDLLELRSRGKEDARGGGEDMMVLGTHLFDLIRFLVGDAAWCFARVFDSGKAVTKSEVRDGPEGIGPLASDAITAVYGFGGGGIASNAVAHFASIRPKPGAPTNVSRFGLQILGTKGVIDLTTGGLPAVMLCEDPNWTPGRSKKPWVEISSTGVGQAEPLKDGGLHLGNVLIVKDLIDAIERDRPPRGSAYDGRGALEMILAVYESHRLNAPVELPLKNRQHPLTLL